MKPDRLADMLRFAVAFDCETHLTQPGLEVPPLVCAAVAMWNPLLGKPSGRFLAENENEDPNEGRVLAAIRTLRALLLDERATIVFANAPFDLCVVAREAALRGEDLLPLIWLALEHGRIYDVLTAEKLHAISLGMLGKDPRTGIDLRALTTGGKKGGTYNLANVTAIRTGREDAKDNDLYRGSYALLQHLPIERWRTEHPLAIQYVIDDTCNTLESALSQVGAIAAPAPHQWPERGAMRCVHCGIGIAFDQSKLPPCKSRPNRCTNLHDLARQVAAHFALKLGALWGFRVDQVKVDTLEARVTKGRAERAQKFLELGLLKWRKKDGVLGLGKDMASIKRRIALAYGCTGTCAVCRGCGKVPKPKLPAFVIKDPTKWDPRKHGNNCTACGATGLDLDSASVPMSDPKNPDSDPTVATGRDPLFESGDELLIEFAEYLVDAKIIEVYIPWLRSARIPHPTKPGEWLDLPLTLWPNELLESKRVSYFGVVQLLPRHGGVRECIVPRPGWQFATVDFEAGEMYTQAENSTLITEKVKGIKGSGWSRLADALNLNLKPHNALAATMVGLTYDDFNSRYKGDKFLTDSRTASKWANFGFGGRMGAWKMVMTCRRQGPDTVCPGGPVKVLNEAKQLVDGFKGLRFCILMDRATYCGREENGGSCMVTQHGKRIIPPTCRRCIECSERLRNGWLKQWSENETVFQFVQDVEENGQQLDDDDRKVLGNITLRPGQMIQHYTHTIRGGVLGNAIANGYFQTLLAEAAKDALVEAQRECTDASLGSVLLGCRVILFAHDELIAEVPDERAHECAQRISVIMVKWLRYYCPHVAKNCRAAPALMSEWAKEAEPVYHSGRLVPWTASHDVKTCTECRAA